MSEEPLPIPPTLRKTHGYLSVDIGKTITRPFHKYIDETLGIRESITIDDKELAALVASIDNNNKLVFVEHLPADPPEVKDGRKKPLWRIWRIEHYRSSYEYYKKIKAESEERVAKFNKRKEQILRIATALSATTGLPPEMMNDLATQMYDTRSEMCKQYVSDIEFV